MLAARSLPVRVMFDLVAFVFLVTCVVFAIGVATAGRAQLHHQDERDELFRKSLPTTSNYVLSAIVLLILVWVVVRSW